MLTTADALVKLQKYCAYQDRCHQEVRNKLMALGVYGADLEQVITQLIEENYLNEVRYAQSYVRGKYRIKKWGRHKIQMGLKNKGITEYCIHKGLAEIDEALYQQNLLTLTQQRKNLYDQPLSFQNQQKIKQYLMRKGYELDLIYKALDDSYE